MRGAKPAPFEHTVPAIMAPDKCTLRPTDLGSPKDDFEFRFNGCDVGRTYAEIHAARPALVLVDLRHQTH